ncbi:uncharacterized protein TNCV_8821 [Trichonephila clavipes]|nr:uncharacterized protein TNCV_8821 [Trichonephila clavipes]
MLMLMPHLLDDIDNFILQLKGLGFGMGSVLIPVVLNQHFDKYLSNANGIAFGGECIAGFVLPVLIKYVLDEYGTTGLFLILSGLMLHSVPAAMLLKFASKPSSAVAKKTATFLPNIHESTLCSGIAGMYNKSFNSEGSLRTHQDNASIPLQNTDLKSMQNFDFINESRSENGKNSTQNSIIKNNVDNYSVIYQHENNIKESNVLHSTPSKQYQHSGKVRIPQNNSIHVQENKLSLSNGPHVLNPHSIGNEKYSQSESSKTLAKSSFSVFCDPAFILMLLTQSTFIFISTMILTIIVDYSRDVGVSTDEEMYILMCLSISDMIGRFGLGLFLGGLLIVCPGIISDHIEKDKVTMALASRFVFYAPMSLTQSSLIENITKRKKVVFSRNSELIISYLEVSVSYLLERFTSYRYQ